MAQHCRSDEPKILRRPEHAISRRDIDPDALKILYRLHKLSFTAYLCGGAVRDLLLGRPPKDFDIVTDARPGQIIGEPAERFTEDAVRIWRVIRHAARLGFVIEEATERAIRDCSLLICFQKRKPLLIRILRLFCNC